MSDLLNRQPITNVQNMKVPIYYSFSDFLENWEKDYSKYLEIYPNCPQDEFLNDISCGYLSYLNNEILRTHGGYKVDNFIGAEKLDENGYYCYYELRLQDFSYYVSNEIYRTSKQSNKSNFDIFSDLTFFLFDFIELQEINIRVKIEEYNKYEKFIFVQKETDKFIFDEIKYKDFCYSVPQILKYIDEYNEAKLKNYEFPLIELNTTTKTQKSTKKPKLSNPEKIAVLFNLGIEETLI